MATDPPLLTFLGGIYWLNSLVFVFDWLIAGDAFELPLSLPWLSLDPSLLSLDEPVPLLGMI